VLGIAIGTVAGLVICAAIIIVMSECFDRNLEYF
jgi:hypothetical protein